MLGPARWVFIGTRRAWLPRRDNLYLRRKRASVADSHPPAALDSWERALCADRMPIAVALGERAAHEVGHTRGTQYLILSSL